MFGFVTVEEVVLGADNPTYGGPPVRVALVRLRLSCKTDKVPDAIFQMVRQPKQFEEKGVMSEKGQLTIDDGLFRQSCC